jgi:hypothetical protein
MTNHAAVGYLLEYEKVPLPLIFDMPAIKYAGICAVPLTCTFISRFV